MGVHVKSRLLHITAVLAVLTSSAIADEYIQIHPREPAAKVFESGDYGGTGAFVRARVDHQEATDWCGNWRPGDDIAECAGAIMQGQAGAVYEVHANCQTGEITDHQGALYRYDRLWKPSEDDFWAGRPRFRDANGNVVPTANAAGGMVIASHWGQLCPYGAPYDVQPLKAVMTQDDYSGVGEIVGHNGSGMYLDYDRGTITYVDPKDSLSGSIVEGAVLFRGLIVSGEVAGGMAYTFKRGCDSAPYKVLGFFQSTSDKLVLEGKAPVRDGCNVTGYTSESPNARLIFDLPHH